MPGVKHIRGDAVYSPLPSGSVDLIIDRLGVVYTCFRYFPGSGLYAIAEAHRILRQGGNLILDGGNLIKFNGIGTYGSSAAQIQEANPKMFHQMENGSVHLANHAANENHRFNVGKFNVCGIPNEWGKVEIWNGDQRINEWLHYRFTKV